MSADDLGRPEVRRRLETYLAEEALPDWSGVEIQDLRRATGGLSWETFFLSVAERDAPERRARLALKRAPERGPLEPYDIRKEASLLAALPAGGVPVPRVLAWTRDPSVIGREFSVMEFVEGENPDLRKIEDWEEWNAEAARGELADQVLGALTTLHRFDWRRADLPAVVGEPGTGAERLARSVDHYQGKIERYVIPRWPAQPMVRHAGLWLKQNAPDLPEDELVIVHGDFRFGNWMWQGRRLAAVMDWERASLGDPMQDLGFLCMPLARQRRPELMGMLVPLEDLAARYESRGDREFDRRRLHFYVIYWQFVEAALVPRGLAYAAEDRTQLRSITAYPQLNINTRQLAELIDDYEAGQHVL